MEKFLFKAYDCKEGFSYNDLVSNCKPMFFSTKHIITIVGNATYGNTQSQKIEYVIVSFTNGKEFVFPHYNVVTFMEEITKRDLWKK